MDTQQIKSFLCVLKTGSFSEAAKLTFRSQPAVSRQIQALEAALEVRLFERFGPLRVKPTAAALYLREIVGPLLEDFGSVKQRLDAKRGLFNQAELKIAANEATIAYLLPQIIADLKKKHPKLLVSLKRTPKDGIVDLVLAGETDFGIMSLEKVPAGIIYRTFSTYGRVAVVPKGHPLSKKKDVSLKDLAEYPLILPPAGSSTRHAVDTAFRQARLKYELFLEVAGRDSAKAYIAKGLGISVMSDYYLLPDERKYLVALDLSEYFGKTSRGILYRKGKILSPIDQEFLGRICGA